MAARVLYWGDSPTIGTGFGVVARHVLNALGAAGHRIDCLAINAVADFPDRDVAPYAIVPAGAPQDPFGYRALLRILTERPYDLLFVQNDLHVAHAAAGYLESLRDRGVALPPILYYYPVDCRVRPDLTGMLRLANEIVTCTAFGRSETGKVPGLRSPAVIPHGVDARVFRPLADRLRSRISFRRAHGIPETDMVVCSVGANNPRKDLPRTIAAFARFRDAMGSPVVLYLHTIPATETGHDLTQAAAACGLIIGRDVVFPRDYHPIRGVSDQAMNEMYNACDIYLTTTLGEGWGLPVTEAMASGLPVVAPCHTSLREIAGDGRAILYECRDRIWVDNSGFRPVGHTDDIVAALVQAARQTPGERQRMIDAARDFAAGLDWTRVASWWVPIVEELVATARRPQLRSINVSASNSGPG